MWFFFGIISFVLFAAVSFARRYKARYNGTDAQYQGNEYKVKWHKNRSGVYLLRLNLRTASKFQFSLFREGKKEKFFKKIGISAEYQVGTAAFDDEVFIASDNEAFCQLLTNDSHLREAIIQIFHETKKLKMALRGIHCYNGVLYCVSTPGKYQSQEELNKRAESILDSLLVMRQALERITYQPLPYTKDPFIGKAAFILAISTGLGIVGAAQLFRSIFPSDVFQLDKGEFLTITTVAAFVTLILFVVFIFLLLGKSSRTHLVLIEALLVGGFGLVSSSYFFMRDVNMELDDSQPKIIKTPIEQLYFTTSRSKGRTNYQYHLQLKEWRNTDEKSVKLQITESLYKKMRESKATQAEIIQRAGYLEYPWIQGINPVEPTPW